MMKIKSVKGLKFRNEIGVYGVYTSKGCLALYEEGKGYVSLDNGRSVYVPVGGRKALQNIIDQGGFLTPPTFVQPV